MLAAVLPTPALKGSAARQNALDHAHVVPGRDAHGDGVAYRRQQPLALSTRLGEIDGMLCAEGAVLCRHQRKPAVEAHDATQLHLGGRRGICLRKLLDKRVERRALGVIDAHVGKRGDVAQGFDLWQRGSQRGRIDRRCLRPLLAPGFVLAHVHPFLSA